MNKIMLTIFEKQVNSANPESYFIECRMGHTLKAKFPPHIIIQ